PHRSRPGLGGGRRADLARRLSPRPPVGYIRPVVVKLSCQDRASPSRCGVCGPCGVAASARSRGGVSLSREWGGAHRSLILLARATGGRARIAPSPFAERRIWVACCVLSVW